MNPEIVRNIIYPAYRFIRHDHVFLKLKEMESNQWLSRQELKDLQWKKLILLLEYVYENVPYYTQLFNESGLKPGDIQSHDDYLKVPVLTKEIIRNNGNRMITRDQARKGISCNTGGSTGETLYFYKDQGATDFSAASIIRLNRWCGKDIGDRERLVLKSKIHKATVTKTNLSHTDSITIDEDLMKMVNLKEYENVPVVNNTNGARLETYVEKGKRGSGIVLVNGAAAHLMKKGDEIIIMSFTWTNKKFVPKAILVDKENKFVKFLEGGVF